MCKININYNLANDDVANMAIVREHYRDHHRFERLDSHPFDFIALNYIMKVRQGQGCVNSLACPKGARRQ